MLPCGALAGAWNPLWPLEELLLDELLDPFEPLDEVEPVELDPEEVEPDELEPDELDPDDELPFTAAWLAPGRAATTTPAAATLARPTVTVVAFSRRRPSSRSATAFATCRARSRGCCPCQLFTLISFT